MAGGREEIYQRYNDTMGASRLVLGLTWFGLVWSSGGKDEMHTWASIYQYLDQRNGLGLYTEKKMI